MTDNRRSGRRLLLATNEFRLDGSEANFTTEFIVVDRDGRTLMTMIQTGFPTVELREEHARGLLNAFNRFERLTRAPGAP